MDINLQAEEREKCQDMAEILSKKHKHLLLQWATGVGKGRAVMKCIAASPSTKQWLIVVPEILQIENYKRDMEKHGFSWMLGTKIVDIICYASIHLWENEQVNLALNECHRLSDLRADVVSTIKFDQIISDSATIPALIGQKLSEICPYYDYEITLTDAINRGILPEPAIYIHRVKLNIKEKRNPYKIGKITRQLTDYEYSKRLDGQIRFWQQKAEEMDAPWVKNKIVQTGGIRKKFLAGAKNEYAKDLLCKLRGEKRFVCYTGSTEQCDELGGKLAIHSGKSKRINEALINAFNTYQIDELYVNKMTREGMNFVGIEAVLLFQLDSGASDGGLSFLQKSGRGMRADSPEIHILVAVDSQDERYLERALQFVDKKYIKTWK